MKTPHLIDSGTAAINMTPMIDVVFLLIIFFLVSSHLAKQENAFKLDLPVADSGLEDTAEAETVVVNILADGQWMLGGVALDEQRLAQQLRRHVMAASEPLRLRIRSDQNVPYERLEPILGMAAEAGLGDIVFSVYQSKTK